MQSLSGIVPSRPPDPESIDMTRKTVMTAALISTFGLALAACGSTIEQ